MWPRFNAAFTKTFHWFLSSVNWIQCILLNPTSARHTLKLSSLLFQKVICRPTIFFNGVKMEDSTNQYVCRKKNVCFILFYQYHPLNYCTDFWVLLNSFILINQETNSFLVKHAHLNFYLFRAVTHLDLFRTIQILVNLKFRVIQNFNSEK